MPAMRCAATRKQDADHFEGYCSVRTLSSELDALLSKYGHSESQICLG